MDSGLFANPWAALDFMGQFAEKWCSDELKTKAEMIKKRNAELKKLGCNLTALVINGYAEDLAVCLNGFGSDSILVLVRIICFSLASDSVPV